VDVGSGVEERDVTYSTEPNSVSREEPQPTELNKPSSCQLKLYRIEGSSEMRTLAALLKTAPFVGVGER